MQLRLCHPGEGHTGRGGKRKKNKTHAVVTQGNGWAPRGAALEARWKAEGRPGSAGGGGTGGGQSCAHRWLTAAQPPAPARPGAWMRPSAAANCSSGPRPAAPVGDAGHRQPPGGRARPAPVLRPDVSPPRSAPGVWGDLRPPPPVALGGQETPGCRRGGGGDPKAPTGSARAGGHLGRGRTASG